MSGVKKQARGRRSLNGPGQAPASRAGSTSLEDGVCGSRPTCQFLIWDGARPGPLFPVGPRYVPSERARSGHGVVAGTGSPRPGVPVMP